MTEKHAHYILRLKEKAVLLFSASLIIPFILFLIVGFIGINKVLLTRDKNYLNSALEIINSQEKKTKDQLASEIRLIAKNIESQSEINEMIIEDIVYSFPQNIGYLLKGSNTNLGNISLFDTFINEIVTRVEKDETETGLLLHNKRIHFIGYTRVVADSDTMALVVLQPYQTSNMLLNFLKNFNESVIINDDEQYYVNPIDKSNKEMLIKITSSPNHIFFDNSSGMLSSISLINNIYSQPIALRTLSIDKSFIRKIKLSFWLGGLLLTIISLLFAAHLSKVFVKYLLKPIEDLSRQMNEIASQPVTSNTIDVNKYLSLSLIVNSFNNILDSFKRYYNSVMRYEKIVTNLRECIFWADSKGLIVTTNNAFNALFSDFYNNNENYNFFQLLKLEESYVEDNLPIDGQEIIVNGSFFLFSLNKLEFENNISYIGLLLDITEQKRSAITQKKLENKLILSKKLAEVGLLIEGISHNLNSPLNNLLGYAQLLQADYPENKDVKKIMENGERMADIIKSLMNRISEEMIFAPHKVDINELVNKELLYFKQNLFFKNMIKTAKVLSPDLPLFTCVYSDISQSLANIISNAIEALQQSSVREMKISTDYVDENILITVKDSGLGIPDDIMQEIAEPLVSNKRSTNKIRGVGLAITKQLIEPYGGSLQIDTEINKGTTITIILPTRNQTVF
ncbi:MAG: ATP-binding protein [Candidatus Cloacimonetes bacterium]|nr:ATP-binding protein [Candidatus Cloacimonadota bacterium]